MSGARLGPVIRALAPFHDRLVLYVTLAGAAGLALPGAARSMDGLVPVFLAGQVVGVASTVDAGRLVAVGRRPQAALAALAVQWTLLPLSGLLLGALLAPGAVRDGAVICAVVPAEITSALVAVLAGASGELALAAMVGSLALGCVLTPFWVRTALGGGVPVDEGGLIAELALSVALPLVVGVGARAAVPSVGRLRARSLDLSAVSVVAVVFVAAGSARSLLGSLGLPATIGLCLLLQAIGYAGGAAVGGALRLPRPERRALLFPLGMREFGIATAVALAVSPDAAAVGGVYGILVMLTGPGLAGWLRRRGHAGSDC